MGSGRVAVFAVNPGEAHTGIVRGGWLEAAYKLFMKPILVTPAQGGTALASCSSSPGCAAKVLWAGLRALLVAVCLGRAQERFVAGWAGLG